MPEVLAEAPPRRSRKRAPVVEQYAHVALAMQVEHIAEVLEAMLLNLANDKGVVPFGALAVVQAVVAQREHLLHVLRQELATLYTREGHRGENPHGPR